MRILIPAIGSRGDVQPYINLAQGLAASGHMPVIATNPTLVDLVRKHGVRAEPAGKPVDMGAAGADIYRRSGGNFYLSFIRTMQFGMRLVQDAYPDIRRLADETDLVIVTDTGAGGPEAERSGVPWVSVTLQPARVPAANPKVSPVMKAIFPLVTSVVMAPTNKFRKKVGAQPVKDMGAMLSTRLTLVPVSPAVSAPNPNWGKHVHMTGYWFAHEDPDFAPPDSLLRFLEAGPKPVVISLGAMSLYGALTRKAAEITLAALKMTGMRAVIQGWDDALRGLALPETIYHAGSIPHGWLFAQAAAVIHHGGFGTTAAGLRSGVPGLIIAHIIDQMYWGDHVTKMGVAPRYIHRPKLTVERLAAGLDQAINNQEMRRKAAALGEQIRAEPDGVMAAVRMLEGVRGAGG